jgi:Ca-activated chloride channel family protein
MICPIIPTVVLFAVVNLTAAQQPSEKEFTLTTESDLVMLDVGVQNKDGSSMTGLTKENFHVYENGKLQPITDFRADDVPITAGLVIDSSGSMRTKRVHVVTGGMAFAHDSNRHDEIFVTEFNDRVAFPLPPAMPFSDNVNELRTALVSGRAEGRTALYDAVLRSLNHLKQGTQSKKALVLISDGGDNASEHGLADVTRAVLESPATIYTVGIFDEEDSDRNPSLLRKLANVTGGEAFFPKQVPDIIDVCRQIAKQIRQRYTIAYHPVRLGDKGELRNIKVVVTGTTQKVTVLARKSYYLPPEH